jgi:hypothetical protein
MRAEAHEFQTVRVRLPVNQHQVRPDMAVAVIFPLASERMIDVALRKRRIDHQKFEGFPEQRVQFLAKDSVWCA